MAANFGASNQVMGVRQTADFLEKSTWGLAISILVLSLVATLVMPSKNAGAPTSELDKAIMEQSAAEQAAMPNQIEMPAEETATESAE